MKIYYDASALTSGIREFIFLDTTTFISAISHPQEFSKLFGTIRAAGIDFLTIPSVLFEFTRGSDSLERFNKRAKFLTDWAGIWPIDRYLDQLEEMIVVLQKMGGNMSYTDFLLCVSLCKFPEAGFLTQNHKDIPIALFDRNHIITVDADKDIFTHVLFQVSRSKFNQASRKIIGKSVF